MLIINVLIAGSVAYAGVNSYLAQRRRHAVAWLVAPTAAGDVLVPQVLEEVEIEDEAESAGEREVKLQHYLRVSTASLLLSVSGGLIYPPLSLVSVPLNLYTTIPLLEKTFLAMAEEGRVRGSTVSAAVTLVALSAEQFFLAGLVNWLHHYFVLVAFRLRIRSEQLLGDLAQNYQEIFSQLLGGHPSNVWIRTGNVEMQVPFEHLHIGDIVIVKAGELIPVRGTITEGMARIATFGVGSQAPAEFGPDDNVIPPGLVISGQIYVRVETLP